LARRLLQAAAQLLAVALIVVIGAATFARDSERSQRRQYGAPGELVDIGDGQLIHLRTWGERRAGQPAILLDASAGMPSSEWAWIGPLLAQEGHFALAYDRPGMGWSTGPTRPRDALSAATALDKALVAADVGPPYVVIGHSYGGLSARAFAGRHPDDVQALVLLDTTDPEGGGGTAFALSYRLRFWQAALGLFALRGPGNDFWQLPPAEQAAADAVSKWPSFLDTAAAELEAWPVSAAQIAPLDLSGLPLLVVSAPSSPEHVAQQRHIAELSADSTYLELPVDHVGMLLSHDQAVLTARAIDEFLAGL
jgi:pimeloyl-ACP methyl ester carboxylesterase